MIPLARAWIGDEEAAAMAAVLRTGWLVQGEQVAAFEAALSPRIGGRDVVACSSGTAALNLAFAALDLPRGTRVAVPDYTFPATINAVLLAGLEPVLVDVDPTTWNLDPDDLLRVLPDVGAVLAVHQFGLPAPLQAVLPELRARGVVLVEDAACALGAAAHIDGAWVDAGAIGALGCFSFHPRKIVTTGEGGCVSSADPAWTARLRLLRNHGMERGPEGVTFTMPGWNFRLTEPQAAMGLVQLGRLDALLADRARLAAGYAGRLAALTARGLMLPRVPADVRPTWQSYVVRLPADRPTAQVVAALRSAGVEANIGAQALHLQPAYRDLPGARRPLPGAEIAMARALSLPVAWGLTDADLDRVADALTAALA